MTITITDPKSIEQLSSLGAGTVEIQTPGGAKLGTFTVGRRGMLPPGVRSPFTEEEMEERRKDCSPGRPLADIIRDLKAKYGE